MIVARRVSGFVSVLSNIEGEISLNYLSKKGLSECPAEGMVLRCDAGAGDGVEQGGLADVGQADDTALEGHDNLSESIC